MIHSKQLEEEDAGSVADLHEKAFRDFFLTRLGSRFLQQFYKALVLRNDTICQGYWDDTNKLVGFFVANYSHKGFYKDLGKKNLFSFAKSSFYVFLLNPLLLVRLAKSFSANNQSIAINDYPYLMSICVSPEFQNEGLGKRMIQDLINLLRNRGFMGIYLTTDAEGNEATNAFYRKNDFTVAGEVYQGKRKMNVYIKKLD
jgi:colanic acid biosynthesis glycosyl transferase WcaI